MAMPIARGRTDIDKGVWESVSLKMILAILSCPSCGKRASVNKQTHKVLDDGTLHPSWVCPYPPCTFHEFVTFENWESPWESPS